MNAILSVFFIASPLLLLTTGALVSEYAGRLAMFLECIINLGAFLCFTFTLAFHNVFLGTLASVLVCSLVVFALEKLASHFNANMFLISLAMNLLFSSMATFLSALIFKTRGVLFDESFSFVPFNARLVTSIIGYLLVGAEIFVISKTRVGLSLRVTGSDSAVLDATGISSSLYKSLSWVVAAVSGALCGAFLTIRLSSYVPGLSSGRGWIALAAVYLGKKRPLVVALAVLLFAIAEYASSYLPNLAFFSLLPNSILLSLPYILALLMIFLSPRS